MAGSSFDNRNLEKSKRNSKVGIVTSSTAKQCYLVGLRTLEKLEIQFVPKTFDINRSANISKIQTIGRNTPFHHYTSGSTELKFQLDFCCEQENRQDVIEKCKWLESLMCNDGYNNPPERIKVIFGDLFRDEAWVVTGCSYKLSNFDQVYGFLPKQAYVDLTLSLDPTYNLSVNDIKWQK